MEFAVGGEAVVGHDAVAGEEEAADEVFGGAGVGGGDGVHDEAEGGHAFEGMHEEGAGDAAAALGGVDDELLQVGAVADAFGLFVGQLDRADEAVELKGGEEFALAGFHFTGNAGPVTVQLVGGDGEQEANAAAILDGIAEEGGELVLTREDFAGGEAADLKHWRLPRWEPPPDRYP